MPKPQWTENYNCHTLRLYGDVAVHVNWNGCKVSRDEPDGYRVSVCSVRLKKVFTSLEEGKQAGIKLARTVATKILELTENAD